MADNPAADLALPEVVPSYSDKPLATRWALAVGQFLRKQPLGTAGIIVIAAMVFMAVFAEQIDRHPPGTIFTGSGPNPDYDPELAAEALENPSIKLLHEPEVFIPTLEGITLKNQSPSSEHWLGTDNNGRDVYARIIHGARVSLYVGILAALMAVILGTIIGLISAYFAGWVDIIIQRFVDSLQAFPALILLLLIIQVVDSPSLRWITIALGILGIAPVIRIVRSAVLATREEVYVLAANSIGASDGRIMARHILPNVTAPIIVIFSTSISVYILAEAGLAFLGFGDPTAISWGKMVNEGRLLGAAKPLLALWSGLAITIAVLGFSLFGDALRDALDPRLRGRGGGRPGF
jgi:peptide/nickel transport system permease protein